jgi:hypothetical protein
VDDGGVKETGSTKEDQVQSNISHRLRRVGLLAAICASATTLAVAVPAHADTKNGPPNSPKGCPVEDEHGNVSYVPTGTVVGLFHCGSDGEWHFGWLTTEMVAPTGHPIAGTTGASAPISIAQ